MLQLEGRRVIVTGAAHGMGREHALMLAEHGAQVAAVDVDRSMLAETVAEIRAHGGEALSLEADVADRAALEDIVRHTQTVWKGIDAVVSNAGNIHTTETLTETDDENWLRTLSIHVGGTLNLTRAALPALIASGKGRIVIISSTWALQGPGFGYAYCTAKAALLGFMRNLAAEAGPYGVCVNAITPGAVPTRMAAGKSQERIGEESQSIPLRRWGRLDEVSGLVCFLCSDDASYLSGQTIGVNGALIPS